MKTIIAGCRDFTDYNILVNAISSCDLNISEVVSGGASGVDSLGERWAKENNVSIKRFQADWKRYGKSAGPIRNKEMAKYGERLIAIWDGKSPGTKNMIQTFGGSKGWDNVIVYMIPTKSLYNPFNSL